MVAGVKEWRLRCLMEVGSVCVRGGGGRGFWGFCSLEADPFQQCSHNYSLYAIVNLLIIALV